MTQLHRLFITLTLLALIAVGAVIYQQYLTQGSQVLRVATTTSLYATGLLDALGDAFRKSHPGAVVQFIAVGTGEALRRAEMGDADLVLVHAPALEAEYIAKGVLGEGVIFAYNYFMIVGPSEDPAHIAGKDPVAAVREIYRAGELGYAVFVSRGDESGTHVREMTLWRLAGLEPDGKSWYLETGSGMAETLRVANERRAYTLTDVGTWLKLEKELKELQPLVAEGDILLNIYSAYIVNQNKNNELARLFMEFITSEEGQEIIREFLPMFRPIGQDTIEELRQRWEWLKEV